MSEEQKYMTNAEGHLVPVGMVKPEDKLQDQLVMQLHAEACQLSKEIATFKQDAFADVYALLQLLSEKYGAKIGGKKGNLTLHSFDGKFRVQVSVNEFIQFGPELQVAKSLIDECIREWSGDSNDYIKTLIFDAFRVDKNNRVNTDRILGLRKLNITDKKWLRAMDAITDSIKVTNSKRYIRFYRRPHQGAEWQAVNLDIARA